MRAHFPPKPHPRPPSAASGAVPSRRPPHLRGSPARQNRARPVPQTGTRPTGKAGAGCSAASASDSARRCERRGLFSQPSPGYVDCPQPSHCQTGTAVRPTPEALRRPGILLVAQTPAQTPRQRRSRCSEAPPGCGPDPPPDRSGATVDPVASADYQTAPRRPYPARRTARSRECCPHARPVPRGYGCGRPPPRVWTGPQRCLSRRRSSRDPGNGSECARHPPGMPPHRIACVSRPAARHTRGFSGCSSTVSGPT